MNIKPPKFHRQKVLLGLLYSLNGSVSKMDFQKYAFLFFRESLGGKYYSFIPYRFGCYSFHLASDLESLEKQQYLKLSETEINLLDGFKPIDWLTNDEKYQTVKYSREIKQQNTKKYDLIKYVYKKHPYFAINSEMINICNEETQSLINQQQIKDNDEEVLYTIGYEGKSFEEYSNLLIKNGVKLLCDVRKNPFSMKFGFSKKPLSTILPKIKIEYLHIPQLGVNSEEREGLNSVLDYKILFDHYKESLPSKQEGLIKIFDLVKQHKKVAITCFEKTHKMCHRHCVSDYLEHFYKIKVTHL